MFFFLSAHGIFSRINHVLYHKARLSKFKKIEITSSKFSDPNATRLEINYKEKEKRRKKKKKNPYTHTHTHTKWRLNNMLLDNQRILKKFKRK